MTVTEGGLLEAVTSSSVPADINAWIRDEARAVGDTAVISPEGEENTFVVYYSGTNEAEWILSIRQTLIGQRMNEYVEELTADGKVEDPKGNLRYLKVQAEAEAAAQESSAAAEGEGSSEDAGSEEGAGSQEGSEASDGAGESSEDAGTSEETENPEGSEASDSAEDGGAEDDTE